MRVAMVGAGPRATSHLRALRASGAGDPVAVWDRNPDRARDFADRFGIPGVFDDIGTMVASTVPDLVDLVTHPSHRLEPIRAAVDAGARAVLVEKPVALSHAELDAIGQLDAFTAANTQYPWMRHWVAARRRIARGELGVVRSVTASMGVGLLDQGAHALSLALTAFTAAGNDAVPQLVDSSLVGDVGSVGFAVGDALLTLVAGDTAPRVPGESVTWYQQQVRVEGSTGTFWSSLNQGWEWRGDDSDRGSTGWPRDDGQSQRDLFTDLAAAVGDPALAAGFPTRWNVASGQARLILDAVAG